MIVSASTRAGPCGNGKPNLQQIAGEIENEAFDERDDRGFLTEKAAQLKLTAADVKQIRENTGFVVCPGTTNNNPATLIWNPNWFG